MIMEQRIRNTLGLLLVLFSAECKAIVLFDAAPQASSAFLDYSSYEPKEIRSSAKEESKALNSLLSKGDEVSVADEEDGSDVRLFHDMLGIVTPHQLTKPNVVRRNYLRFGKKRSPPKAPAGLERRDYREFVRFGKRSQDIGHGSSKSFLRFGRKSESEENPLNEIWSGLSQDEIKALRKRVNDYLRFG